MDSLFLFRVLVSLLPLVVPARFLFTLFPEPASYIWFVRPFQALLQMSSLLWPCGKLYCGPSVYSLWLMAGVYAVIIYFLLLLITRFLKH